MSCFYDVFQGVLISFSDRILIVMKALKDIDLLKHFNIMPFTEWQQSLFMGTQNPKKNCIEWQQSIIIMTHSS